ncbi:NAD-dependent epimerase/dehydratase family protein [Chryseobacterium salviniae]|uniref:dTDP-4-dehydrorhamnose reductase n=1 Tax=Chryseobacterium salviniae TaxID=3101750 RepID=A0ABU6HZQ4_9FLAO|nr:NAD-dependent epimerase/dehydratase family protein [Chryseobacterium sp. T9W2-O]MEC3877600.1 NAD-dependent epimerase/dehydratase family protein [Chryseobacterium sp. T9W2-O]
MKAKVLLTGASGFIGKRIFEELKDDFEITAISSSAKSKIFTKLNLLDASACHTFFKNKKFDVIIHAAAIAHGKNNVNSISVDQANVLMTNNIFNNLNVEESIVIYLSSVAVYSYKNNKECISIYDKPIPVTKYGKSKLKCEEILQKISTKSLHILRLAPVYSENNMKDLGKRVFLPILKVPFLTKHQRIYSLCHISEVVYNVKDVIKMERSSLSIVKDKNDHDQKKLLSLFKTEEKLIIHTKFINILFSLLNAFSFTKFDNIREMFYKLFFSVKYSNN